MKNQNHSDAPRGEGLECRVQYSYKVRGCGSSLGFRAPTTTKLLIPSGTAIPTESQKMKACGKHRSRRKTCTLVFRARILPRVAGYELVNLANMINRARLLQGNMPGTRLTTAQETPASAPALGKSYIDS